MAEVNYESIQSLIESAVQDGASMKVTFKCPASGATVESSASIQKGKGVADIAKASAQKNMMYSLRRGVLGMVRSVLGGGMFGRMGQDVARSMLSEADKKAKTLYSEDEKNGAVVSAFEAISSQWVHDAKNNRWVLAKAAGELLSEFDKKLQAAPIKEKYDRAVLARMLVEIANADGNVAEEEKSFLAGFVTPDLGTVDDLLAKPALSAAELGEVSQGAVREVMVMLDWAVAFTDEELAEEETAKIQSHAAGLGIDAAKCDALKGVSQSYLFEQALSRIYSGGQIDAAKKNEVMSFGKNIGMDESAAERAEIRYRKRHGLV